MGNRGDSGPAQTTGNSFEETSHAYLHCLHLAFLLVLAPTVPAMADSGGDIVFERMQAQAAKARAAHQEKLAKQAEATKKDKENC